MTTKKYWDELRAGVINVLDYLKYNGDNVLLPTHSSGRGLQIKDVADPTDPQDVMTKNAFDNGAPGGAILKVNSLLPDPSKNVDISLDSVAQINNESTVPIMAPVVAYSPSWAGSKTLATQGGVYDEMEKKVDKVQDHSLIPDSELAKLQGLAARVSITLPAETTVAGRVLNAVEGVDYPTGWTLSAGASPVDLEITHGLDSFLDGVSVLSIDGGTGEERVLPPFSQAFTGLVALDKNTLLIEGLTEVPTRIRINISMI